MNRAIALSGGCVPEFSVKDLEKPFDLRKTIDDLDGDPSWRGAVQMAPVVFSQLPCGNRMLSARAVLSFVKLLVLPTSGLLEWSLGRSRMIKRREW